MIAFYVLVLRNSHVAIRTPRLGAFMYQFEQALWKKDIQLVAGTDEAGRGPLAGPVVASCVILPAPDEYLINGLNDSKLLSEKKRENLFQLIQEHAQVGIGVISEKTIDKINIYQATRLAMKTAFENLPVLPNYLLIDGPLKLDIRCPSKSIIKGDRKSASIAAASIIAKVTRDRLMKQYDEQYPQYNFKQHKGYATKRHKHSIEQFGPCPIHRRSFSPIKDLVRVGGKYSYEIR